MYQHRSLVGIYDNAFDIDGMYVDYNDTGMSFRNYDKYLMIGAGGHRTGKKSISFKELDGVLKYLSGRSFEARLGKKEQNIINILLNSNSK